MRIFGWPRSRGTARALHFRLRDVTGALPGVDVSSVSFNGLSCDGCFASVEETNHGGTNDSFTRRDCR